MKILSIFLTGLFIMAGFILLSSSFKTLPPGPSANGQGTLTNDGQTRHFSFHAKVMPNNSVKGSGVLTYTAGGLQIKFDITCLNVVGNEARMSGIITSDNQNPARIGTGCAFRVVDNGEGGASVDEMSLMAVGLTGVPPCQGILIALDPIEGGNIQVKN